MSIVRRSAGFGAVLAAAFILGFAGETASLFDEVWPGVLLLGALVLLATAAVAASLGERVTFPTAVTAVIVGLLVGCVTGITFLLGAISPFALELGQRDLNELGGGCALGRPANLCLDLLGSGGRGDGSGVRSSGVGAAIRPGPDAVSP